jgi:hypothetical protein
MKLLFDQNLRISKTPTFSLQMTLWCGTSPGPMASQS